MFFPTEQWCVACKCVPDHGFGRRRRWMEAVGWGSSLYSFRITPDLGDNYTAYCLSHGNHTLTCLMEPADRSASITGHEDQLFPDVLPSTSNIHFFPPKSWIIAPPLLGLGVMDCRCVGEDVAGLWWGSKLCCCGGGILQPQSWRCNYTTYCLPQPGRKMHHIW